MEIQTDSNFGNSNDFSAQKQVVSKKKVFTEIESDSSAKIGNLNDFSAQKQVISKRKKKKVFTEIESDFSAKIRNSNTFSHRITTSTSRLRHPISFGGGCFQFFTKNWPKKQRAPRPPGYATGHWYITRISTNKLIAKIIKILGGKYFIRLAKLIKLLSVKYLDLQY